MTGSHVEMVRLDPSDARRLRMLWDAGRLIVGERIGIGGRLHVIRSFDPVGTHDRRVYAEDPHAGILRRFVIPNH